MIAKRDDAVSICFEYEEPADDAVFQYLSLFRPHMYRGQRSNLVKIVNHPHFFFSFRYVQSRFILL